MSTAVITASCGCKAQVHTDEHVAPYAFEIDYCSTHDAAQELLGAAKKGLYWLEFLEEMDPLLQTFGDSDARDDIKALRGAVKKAEGQS